MSDKNILLNELKEIFHLVSNWLQFAETKNGVAIAFIGGVIYSFNSFESNLSNGVFLSLYLLLILSFLSSLLSFYPNVATTIFLSKLSKLFFIIAQTPKEKPQPIDQNLPEIKSFYGNIAANYEINDYEIFLKNISNDYYGKNQNFFSTLEKEYAKEIIILSKITTNKYIYFKSTLKLIITFTISFVLILGYNKIFKNNYYSVLGKDTIAREIPNINGYELFKIEKGISVKKIDIEGEWIKIEIKNKSGWVHKSLLEKI